MDIGFYLLTDIGIYFLIAISIISFMLFIFGLIKCHNDLGKWYFEGDYHSIEEIRDMIHNKNNK